MGRSSSRRICGKWLAKTGAKTLYIEPGSPWENGYCESFNSKLRDEFLNGEIFLSMKELRVLAECWRVHYNTIRPHSSLGYRSPAPEAWQANNMGHGEVEIATRFPLLHTPDDGYLNSEGAALHQLFQRHKRSGTPTHKPVIVGFRSAYVFDVSQTEGAELPEFSKVSGTVGEYRERLIECIAAQSIALEFKESIAPALGMSYGGRIPILPGQQPAEEFSTLVHELAHEMLRKAERRTATTRTVRETEAEAVAFVVAQTIGLNAGRASAECTVRNMLTAIEAPLYDVGVLSSRGMLPGLDAIPGSAVLERLALLKRVKLARLVAGISETGPAAFAGIGWERGKGADLPHISE